MIFYECDKSIHSEPIVCEAAGELKIINNSLAMCSQGEWYTLCGNTSSWTQAQARVACRQMGLNPNGKLKKLLNLYLLKFIMQY